MSGQMFTTKDTKSTKKWKTEDLMVGLVFERVRLEVGDRRPGEGVVLRSGRTIPHLR